MFLEVSLRQVKLITMVFKRIRGALFLMMAFSTGSLLTYTVVLTPNKVGQELKRNASISKESLFNHIGDQHSSLGVSRWKDILSNPRSDNDMKIIGKL